MLKVPREFSRGAKIKDAYARGLNHGNGIACHNVPRLGDPIDKGVDYVGLGDTVDAENIREYHELLCHAGADNSRQYSPFECTASEFNSRHNSDRLWEAFEAGTHAAISSDLAGYTDAQYGLED